MKLYEEKRLERKGIGRKKIIMSSLISLLSLAIFSGTAFGEGNVINFNIIGISGWVPSKLAGKMAPQFEKYAKKKYNQNIKIHFTGAPFSSLEQKMATSFSSHSSHYDLIISDSQWLGAFAKAGWIVKLNKLIKNDPRLQKIENQFSKPVRWSYQTYPYKSNNLYGLPQEGDVLLLYLRKDELDNKQNQKEFKEKYGWSYPLTEKGWKKITWKKYSQIIKFFNHPKKGQYGFAAEYSKTYDFMSDHAMSMMWTWGGHIWNRKTKQVYGVLNSKVNDKALNYYVNLLKYQPPGADTYGISGVVQALNQGKVFSGITWSAMAPAILNGMKGKFLIVPPPGKMENGHIVRHYCLGGQPWVINKFINQKHKKVAIEFLKWWYKESTQREFAKKGGNPVISSLLNSKNFNSIHPWYKAYRYMLTSPKRAYDFWHLPTYSGMLQAQQQAWTALATGQIKSAKLANKYAACKQQKILYNAGISNNKPPSTCNSIHLH